VPAKAREQPAAAALERPSTATAAAKAGRIGCR